MSNSRSEITRDLIKLGKINVCKYLIGLIAITVFLLDADEIGNPYNSGSVMD